MNDVRRSILPVIENSKHVSIGYSAIKKFLAYMNGAKLEHWFTAAPFDIAKLEKKDHVAFAFVLDSISFSYWGDPKWTIAYKDRSYDGAKAMIACIGRAIDDGLPILDPNYLQSISREAFQKIFAGNIEIPLAEERRNILQVLGKNVIANNGFKSIIEMAGGDAEKLLEKLISIFPYFNDEAAYGGEKIYFYKRAQLLVADLCQILRGTKHELKNIEALTACADYKLPQVLRKVGILRYSRHLSKIIDEKIELASNSQEEIEIRANTIFVVDIIARILGLSANAVNDFIWLASQQEYFCDKPYHRTRTTAY